MIESTATPVTRDPRNSSSPQVRQMTKPGFFSQLLSLGQVFRFFNDPSYRERILARCFYGFFLILFFFSLYATISDTF